MGSELSLKGGGGEGRDRILQSSPFLKKLYLYQIYLFCKTFIGKLLFVFSPEKCKFFVLFTSGALAPKIENHGKSSKTNKQKLI